MLLYAHTEHCALLVQSISVNWEQYKGEVEPETLAMFQKAYTGGQSQIGTSRHYQVIRA